MENENKKLGRPTKFKKIFIDQVYELALLGLSNKEMAKVLGIVESTFQDWVNTKKAFSESIKNGRYIADGKVIRKALDRAIGYDFEEIKETTDKLGRVVKTETTKKHIAPDGRLLIHWLNNRHPQKWNNSQKIELGSQENPFKNIRWNDEEQESKE